MVETDTFIYDKHMHSLSILASVRRIYNISNNDNDSTAL